MLYTARMLRRSSHSVWDCRYHLVWATKRRRKALKFEGERAYCEKLLRRVAEKYDMFVAAIAVDEDHVHMYVEIPPQLSVGAAVRAFKSLSARYMLKRYPYLKRYFWAGPFWSPSYFVRSVGEGVTAETVRRYIKTHDEEGEPGPVQADLFPRRPPKRKKGSAGP